MDLTTIQFDAQVRIANVLGDFKTNSIKLCMSALISGATAANCMINGLDYNEAMRKFTKDMTKHEFRKVFNTFDNDAMDLFCSVECFPIIKQFIFNNPLLKATYGITYTLSLNLGDYYQIQEVYRDNIEKLHQLRLETWQIKLQMWNQGGFYCKMVGNCSTHFSILRHMDNWGISSGRLYQYYWKITNKYELNKFV